MREMNEELAAEVKALVTRELPRWIEEALARRKAPYAPETQRKMTYAEFFGLGGRGHVGRVGGPTWGTSGGGDSDQSSVKATQSIAGFLNSIIRTFVEQNDLGAVLTAPFQMKLEHGREPDVLFVATEHLDRLQETFLDGPADLAIEIISPESASRDWGDKFYEYEAGGVREYWLIDPLR